MIEGSVEVVIGDVTYMAAPLNFRALIEFAPFIESMRSGMTIADLGKVAALIGTSIRRNVPDLSDDILLDNLDLTSGRTVLAQIMSLSGGKSATEPGEAKPVAA